MIPNLYICSTYYHVLVTLCKVMEGKQRTDVVLCDDIPEAKTLMESLIHAGCFSNVFYFDKNRVQEYLGKNKFDWIFLQHRRSRREIEKEFKLDLRRYQNIYIYHDDILLGHYLNDIRHSYHLLEDSQDFYKVIQNTPFARCLPQHSVKYKLRRFLRSGYFPLGQSPYVIDIEVNDKNGLAIRHKHLVELPKDKLFAEVGEEERNLIFKIFMSDEEVSLLQTPHSLLLLTQPLFIDGYVESAEDQDAIYSNLIQDFKASGHFVIIKQHPRDYGCYAYMHTAPSLKATFPIEVLNFSSTNLDCVVTISSTAIRQIKFASNKIVLGIDKLREIERRVK